MQREWQFDASNAVNFLSITPRWSQYTLYFLPLFLIPCAPVFIGPLPPALDAISLRAFSSASCQPSMPKNGGWVGVDFGESESYRRASSRGKPGHPRRALCSPSWPASRAWPCRLVRRGVSDTGRLSQSRISVSHLHDCRHPWYYFAR